VDKKTSVLDYVVKKILSKGDDKLLNVADDISLADEVARLSGSELTKSLQAHSLTLQSLTNELERVKGSTSSSTSSKLNAIAVTEEITKQYIKSIETFLNESNPRSVEMSRLKTLMIRKTNEVIEYFGEDSSTCDTNKIFNVLMEFRRAIITSKNTAIQKLHRQQQQASK
jgi:hypothetical protein